MARGTGTLGCLKYLVVSTFNRSGRELYGERMMKSFEGAWPEAASLRIYAEGWEESTPLASIYRLLECSPWLSAFKARHKSKPTSNYRMDAVRFSHKVAAICHAARHMTARYLVWMDGDTFTHSKIAVEELDGLAPNGEVLAWLDRKGMYPECGFMIFDTQHERFNELIDVLELMYSEDWLFDLPEWHDSFVLEHVVKKGGFPVKSLSGDGHSTMHPMINGPLGQWFDHAKGNRKNAGRSSKRDLVKPRSEPYWQ
jgi:hypothetical protein